MKELSGLVHYLSDFEATFGLTVIIKDYVGFLEDDTDALKELQRFYIHQKPYCMAIKSNKRLWDFCLYQKKCMHHYLENNKKPYMGTCYAGVGEYVMPIVFEETVIGSLNIGTFRTADASKIIKRLAKHHELSDEVLQQHYDKSTTILLQDLKSIEYKLYIITDYLSLKFNSQILKAIKHHQVKDNNYMITHAIAYIEMNYASAITLKDVALFCHCSSSTLSHQFKLKTGVTLPYYVNQIRIKKAKELLDNNLQSVTEVGYLVGFSDGNYFSTVFKNIEGYSPRHYMKGIR